MPCQALPMICGYSSLTGFNTQQRCKTSRKCSYFIVDDSQFSFLKAVHCHVCVSQCHIFPFTQNKIPPSAAPSCAESGVSSLCSLTELSHISLNMEYELFNNFFSTKGKGRHFCEDQNRSQTLSYLG